MPSILWKKFIAPKSKDKDRARREYILNILLLALIGLSAIAFVINIINYLFYSRYIGENPLISGFILFVFLFLFFLSRKGKSYFSSFILVLALLFINIYVSLQWGADLPASLLLFAFTIVMTGILLGTAFSFGTTIIGAITIILLSYLEIAGIIHPDRMWKFEGLRMADSIVSVIILAIITVVSWLSNRELEKSLKRARASERELKHEKDQLEIKVEERTRELQRIQLEKISQLYRFAEVGRLTSGFMHDLVTPISLISLNLHRLNKENQQKNLDQINILLKRAINGTKYLENFVITARKQLQNQEIKKTFSLSYEVKHIIQVLAYKIKKSQVKIIFDHKESLKIFGNPIRFNQIAMNLILNAVDAYHNSQQNNKIIKISLKTVGKNIQFRVQDFGIGIPQENLNKVFDPFFTTKSPTLGTGIGLSITQDIIKKHFKGKISVTSNKNSGTTFTVLFPKHAEIVKS